MFGKTSAHLHLFIYAEVPTLAMPNSWKFQPPGVGADFDHVFLCFLESSSKENLDQTVNSLKKMAGITVLESTSNAEDDVT